MSVDSSVSRIGLAIRDLRRSIGWSERELAARAGVSQSLVSFIERGRLHNLSFESAGRLLEAMGGRLIIDAAAPFLGDRERQREPAHVRCATYVVRRLERDDWQVATEVEIGGDRFRGWIDVLAYNAARRLLLLIEINTEIHDLGAIERALGWYERECWSAARRMGWYPDRLLSSLMLLSSAANDVRIRENRDSLARLFPVRASELAAYLRDPGRPVRPGRSLALIDPLSRRRDWLRPSRTDGRRSAAPYVDYIDFVRRASLGHAPSRRST